MSRQETLSHVVADFLLEAGLGEAEFTRSYHLALRAVKELAYDVTGKIRTAKLLIKHDGTADIPEDCLKITKIGYIEGGEFRALTRNNNLSKISVGNCQCACNNQDPNCLCRVSNVHGRFEGDNVALYYPNQSSLGVGSWTNLGEYKIDSNSIYFSSNLIGCGKDIFVEYNSFIEEDEAGDIMVHPYIREAVIAFIHWKYELTRKSQFRGDRPYYESLWHRLKRNARTRLKSNTIQELNQNARQHTKGGIKS